MRSSQLAFACLFLWLTQSTNIHAERIWDMARLSEAPKWTTLQEPKSPDLRAILYDGPSYQGKPTRIFAWLGIPRLDPGQKAPGMVLIHGGGGTAFAEWVKLWVDRGYAAIAMDTCGAVPVGNYGSWMRHDRGGPPGWGGWDQMSSPREDQWTYHAVAAAVLANSLLRSLPEVEPDCIGVTGISWGGYLTCIVAGIDHRLRLAVPVYGCGFTDQHAFANNVRKLGNQGADQWMLWWDPAVYLPEAPMPFLWVNGSNDFAYTLNAYQLSYRLAKGSRTLCIRLRMPHGHGGAGERPAEIHAFVDSILKNGAPLHSITGQGRDGFTAWATYNSKLSVVRGELNVTCDTGRWQDRQWEVLPALLQPGRVTAQIPAGATVYYLNLVDERDCVVSTEHEEMASQGLRSLKN